MGRNRNDDICNSKDVTKGGAINGNDNELHNQYNMINEGEGEGKRYHPGHPSLPGAFYFLRGTTISTALFTTIVALCIISVIYS